MKQQQKQQQATPRHVDRVSPAGGEEAGDVIDVEQAEAALVEHYPRLVRLAYLVLPPGQSRSRRVLAAHGVVQRALPRQRSSTRGLGLPAQRAGTDAAIDPGYAFVRLRVLRAALSGRRAVRRPPLFPQVWGLRLFPRSGGADELALDQALSALSGPARAAFVLRDLERLSTPEARRVLEAAGVAHAREALDEAERAATPAGSRDRSLLESPEFDPCALQARPTDLIRRRQHGRAVLAAGAAVLVSGALLGMPGDGWGPDGAAAPPYARNAAAEAALDPGKLTVTSATAWKHAARQDFAAWPARGDRIHDRALLRRALAVWARPGAGVQVSATPGTAPGPAAGPAQLLFAGVVDHAVVVLLHDGLRVVRYAEAADGSGQSDGTGAALDFARVDGAAGDAASALVASRTQGNVRYLTAPWVKSTRLVDLVKPDAAGQPVAIGSDGVTSPVPTAQPAEKCTTWPALQAGGRLLTDLGELTPARLTYGRPRRPGEVTGRPAKAAWARTACQLAALRGQGVRTVNAWEFARQPLPTGAGLAAWLCTRAETWRGAGSWTMAQIQTPAPKGAPYATGTVTARAEGGTACGPRNPRALAGVLWKSPAGTWWLLAAGSGQVTSITARSGLHAQAAGHFLAAPAKAGDHAELTGRLATGGKIEALH
ncbi:hypothetical protein BX264_1869 [Streptomyces sp. 2333.5]|uniref:hypothetical protein n=1 Tax=unclassified Streptomyces TaxID=2593676 RepID=UPI0008943DBA|nr:MULTISPECIES: hypothetical protein [unclassified Streptomyces]PJJ01560.1 hypothetical protein BX264_1869 [Streptomyces sp. 2333.5]SEC68759.1 hypothetical protein SAMN05428943_2012 [Streptomyces sp. 2314.4]SED47263.1 hypothetical protein SAMN05428942_1885 [Streptomyces sp. 2112.2]